MSIVLNGSTQYAWRIAPVVDVAPFSVSAWFKSTSDSALQAIWGEGRLSTTYDYWRLDIRGNVGGNPVGCYVRRNEGASAETSSGYTINTWHNAIFIEAGGQNHQVYIDGGYAGIDTVNDQVPIGEDRMAIGALPYNGSWVNYFAGKLAYLTLWSIAISAEDRASLAGGADPSTIQSGSIIANYPLEENANDTSGNNLHLTTVNSPTFDSEDVPTIEGGGGSSVVPSIVSYYNNFLRGK